MPVKLRRPKKRTMQISDEAVEAFRLCEEITAAGLQDAWEDDGGRRDEYLTAHRSLLVALSLRPCEASPCDAPDEGECPYDASQLSARPGSAARASGGNTETVMILPPWMYRGAQSWAT